MSQSFVQILIYVIAYIFQFSIPVWVGCQSCVSGLPVQTVPSVHCDQNEAVTKDNQNTQHALHDLMKC